MSGGEFMLIHVERMQHASAIKPILCDLQLNVKTP